MLGLGYFVWFQISKMSFSYSRIALFDVCDVLWLKIDILLVQLKFCCLKVGGHLYIF